MTLPEGITPEAWEKARGAYLTICAIGGTDSDFVEAIARALMEAEARGTEREREACALIALANTSAPKIWEDGRWISPACREIAVAIRQRGKNE